MASRALLDKFDIEVLDSDNYYIWKQRMEMFLIVKDLWIYVKFGIPAEDTAAIVLDGKAKAYIGMAVKTHLLSIVMTSGTSKAAWDALASMFEPKIAARQIVLQRDFLSLRKMPDETLNRYLGRVRELYGELLSVDFPISERVLVTTMLAGLPSEFDDVVTVYTQKKEDESLDLNEIQAKLISHENLNKAKLQSHPIEVPAFGHFSGPTRRPSPSPAVRRNAQFGNNRRFNGNCNYCGITDHMKRDCRKFLRDQAAERESGRPAPKPAQFSSAPPIVFMAMTSAELKTQWILDSGAEYHVCNDRDMFPYLEESDPLGQFGSIRSVSGHITPVLGMGSVFLTFDIGEGRERSMLVHNVLYVPSAAANLLSVKLLTKIKEFSVNFSGNQAVVSKKWGSFY